MPNSIIDEFRANPIKIGAFAIAKRMEYEDDDNVVSPQEFGYMVGWNRSRSYKFLSGIRVLTGRKPIGNRLETLNPLPEGLCAECGNGRETVWKHWGCSHLILDLKEEEEDKANPKFPKGYLEWLEVELWEQWKAERISMRKPLSENSERLALIKLRKLIDAGEDQREVLEEAIIRRYQGLFPVKDRNGNPSQQSADQDISKPSQKYREITG